MNTAWEASAAAAGALLMLERAQDDLRKLADAPRIVITPRTTRLLRVPDLQAMHRALAECVTADSPTPLALDRADVRRAGSAPPDLRAALR